MFDLIIFIYLPFSQSILACHLTLYLVKSGKSHTRAFSLLKGYIHIFPLSAQRIGQINPTGNYSM